MQTIGKENSETHFVIMVATRANFTSGTVGRHSSDCFSKFTAIGDALVVKKQK